MAWTFLIIAGVAEIVFALSLKYSQGFTRLWPSIATCLFGAASFCFLLLALKTLPIGMAYAVRTGMGAVGVAIAGIILFKEPTEILRLVSIALVVIGIIGLRMTHTT